MVLKEHSENLNDRIVTVVDGYTQEEGPGSRRIEECLNSDADFAIIDQDGVSFKVVRQKRPEYILHGLLENLTPKATYDSLGNPLNKVIEKDTLWQSTKKRLIRPLSWSKQKLWKGYTMVASPVNQLIKKVKSLR